MCPSPFRPVRVTALVQKVSREGLDTCIYPLRGEQKKAPSPKTITAANKPKNYKLARAATVLFRSDPTFSEGLFPWR